MRVEQHRQVNIQQQTSSGLLVDVQLYAQLNALRILVPLSEIMARNTEIQYAPRFFGMYLSAIEEGYTPFIVANHQSHADGLGLAKLTDDLTAATTPLKENRINGFWLPVAGSIFTGHQGPVIKTAIESALPFLKKHNLQLTPLNRKKDIEVYGLPPNNIGFTKKLRQEVRNNHGVALLPEGSVHSAETNPETGEMFGMQSFEPGGIEYIIQIIEWEKRKALLIPVSTHGGYEIINSDTRRPTPASYRAALRIGPANFIAMYVDSPIRIDELKLEEGETVTGYMENVINNNLPKEAQKR